MQTRHRAEQINVRFFVIETPAAIMDTQTAQSTHSAFLGRLEKCIELVGNINKLAEKAEVSPNAIRRYENGSEPTRGMIISLAAAAGVTPEWLAFGTEKQNANPGSDDAMAPAFLERFRQLVTRHGGPQDFAQSHHLDVKVVEAILSGGPITLGHLAPLASEWNIPIRWLISDQRLHHGALAPEHLKTLRDFINRIDAIDDRRVFKWELAALKNFDGNPSWRTPVLELLAKEYEWIPPGDYDFHEVKVAVGPYAAPGDVAVIDPTATIPETGLYLFKERAVLSDFMLLRYVSRTGGVLRDVSAGDNTEALSIAEENYECLGRVVILVRKFNR